MTLIDECIVFNKSLKDDLKEYTVNDTNVIYSDGLVKAHTMKISDLQGFFPSDYTSYSGAWFPVMISGDSSIDNKILSNRGSLLNSNSDLSSGRIGIEDFISFEPLFQNWNMDNNQSYMVADWVLNRSATPFYLKDGILCWAQVIPTTPTSNMIREYALGSRLQSQISNTSDVLIKYQDNKLYNTTSDQSILNNAGTFSFSDSTGVINVGGTGVGGPYYYPSKVSIYENRSNNTTSSNVKTLFINNTMLWIADGDYFSYFDDSGDAADTNISSKSYISPSLWSKYTQIYHMLTLREPKNIGSIGRYRGKNVNRARKLKKLAHILATSPYITDDCINILDHSDIRSLVGTYLDGAAQVDVIGTIKEIVKLFHHKFKLLQKINTYNINNTLTNNVITNKAELFTKIVSKYGLRLKMSGDTTLTYKTALTHGDSINIIQGYQTMCSKTYTSQSVINNQKITLNKISLTSSMSDTSTSLSLQVEANPVTKIPLYDIAIQSPGSMDLNIILNKSGDKIDSVAGPANYIYKALKKIDGSSGKLAETSIPLSTVQRLDNGASLDNIASFQSIVSCFWEKIKGPCLKFDDENKSSAAIGSDVADYQNSRFDTSTYIEPSVYVYAMGEYEIQCTFVTSYGTYIKRKKFFVVDGVETFGDPPENNPHYGKYYENGVWVTPPAQEPNRLKPISVNRDKLDVKIASFKNIALHKHCLFWPLETDHMIEKVFAGTSVKDSLRQKYKFWFGLQNPADFSPQNENSTLAIKYITGDTIIKLDTIILQNLRNPTNSCKNCMSMYRPLYESSPSLSTSSELKTIVETYGRTNKDPDELVLEEYRKTSAAAIAVKTNLPKTFPYPQISMDFAPPILSYGGYSSSLVSQIGIQISGHPTTGTALSGVAGHKLNYRADDDSSTYKACFQQAISPTGYIEFTKGVFHPSSGFILNTGVIPSSIQNKTSVLKFNPGARDTFNFIGPGLFRITNTYAGSGTGLTVSPIIYQSAINLAISPFIQPAPPCENPKLSASQAETLNKTHKQYLDQYILGRTANVNNKYPYRGSYPGYRSLEGGRVKLSELGSTYSAVPVNDEFGFGTSEFFCDGEEGNADVSTFSYKFATNGPNYEINNTGIQFKIPGATIQDIEVKLNFLNYVNPKNLVVWLDINPSEQEKKRLRGGKSGKPTSPLAVVDSQFMDQTIPTQSYGRQDIYTGKCPVVSGNISGVLVDSYLHRMTEMNSTAASSEPLRLFLLNQEYIQNNKYNLNIKFTDHASKYNVLYDENKINPYGVNTSQMIFQDGQELLPSIATTGFNDIDMSICKNIIRKNKLNITNNSFSKYKNLSLFVFPPPEDDLVKSNALGPGFDSSTTFTLNVMVVDEPDEMIPYDTVISNPYLTNFSSTENKKTSTQIYNSLCNWELILHTNKYEKYTASMATDLSSYGNSDVLGLIDYKNGDPKIPGYNFISMSPSGSTYYSYFDTITDALSLIPTVNINAPYTYINDTSLCQSANPNLIGTSTMLQPPRFPIESVLMVLVGLAGGALTGSLVGLGVFTTAGFNMAYQGLFDYFYALREAKEREGRDREVYQPNYDHFPFGSPEKVLLNVSKDGGMWYKLEASIFRYKNTPALYSNKYKFIRLKRGNIPLFSEFNIETVSSIAQLVDKTMLDIIQESPPDISVSPTPSPTPLTTPSHAVERLISNSDRTNQLNHILSYQKSFFGGDLLAKINSKKIVIIKGKLAYYVLHIGDSLPYYKSGERDGTPVATNVAKIINKALILKDNLEYTVLETDTDLSSYDILACNGDTIVVFKDNKSNLHEVDPFGIWGLEKNPIASEAPNVLKSATGLGSYGDGSPFVRKNILTYKLQHNKLYTIYEIFNNHINDKIKKTTVNLILKDGTIKTINSGKGFYGYGFSNRDIQPIFQDKYNQIIANIDSLQDKRTMDYIFSKLQYNTTNIKNDNYTFMFLKCSEFKEDTNFQHQEQETDEDGKPVVDSKGNAVTKGVNNEYGDITVLEDLVKLPLIEKLSDTTINSLKARINRIENTSFDSTLSDAVGNPASTSTIINAGRIYYVAKHLEALSDDPIDCYKKLTSVNADGTYSPVESNCPKKQTRKALQDLYTERSTLLQIISMSSGVPGVYGGLSDRALPLQRIDLSGVDAGGANPVYSKLIDINQNLYWINIDPKQSCTIAEEMCPRVLKSVKYTCNPITRSTLFIHADNNICADFLSKSDHKIEDGGDIDVKITSVPYWSYRAYEYTVPTGIVEQKKTELKTKYSSIYSWGNFVKNRTFRINTDNGINDIYGGTIDLLVKVEEEYELGLPEHLASPNFTIPGTNDNSGDIKELVPLGDCSPVGAGSPGGSGLLTINNTRAPLTRVYNIFNLDSTDTLKIQFRKIPRQIRGIDLSATVYRYGRAGEYRQTSPGNPPSPTELDVISGEGALNNLFYEWNCIERDPDTKKAKFTTPPQFLKLQNEMMYRAFYGSKDGIENKEDKLQSLYPWELIPYEYFMSGNFPT